MITNGNSNKTLRGIFLSVEGSEGSGKSTNIQFLSEQLKAKEIPLLLTREPGGTSMGEKLRQILLSPSEKICDKAELMLMFAARAQHVERVIKPALEKGLWVLSDRFTDATFAYQGGGRGIDAESIRELEKWTLGNFQADHTFLLDVPVETGMQRVRERGELDRFEQEKMAFFERVRASYLLLAEQHATRISTIDASQSLEQVQAQLANRLQLLIDANQELTN